MHSIQKPQISILTLAMLIISVIRFANRPQIWKAFFWFQKVNISSAFLLFNTITAKVRPQGISKTGQHLSIFYENLHLSLCFSLPIWIWHSFVQRNAGSLWHSQDVNLPSSANFPSFILVASIGLGFFVLVFFIIIYYYYMV